MFIKSIRLLNYKSYIDSGELEFTPGINIIIGKNNSGKTALLEALILKLSSNPHRSIKKLPNRFSKINSQSSLEVVLSMEKNELINVIDQLIPPIGLHISSYFEDDIEYWTYSEQLEQRFKEWLDKLVHLDLGLRLSSESENEVENTTGFFDSDISLMGMKGEYQYADLGPHKPDGIGIHLLLDYNYEVDIDGVLLDKTLSGIEPKTFRGGKEKSLRYKVFDLFRNRIYRFYAERLNISSCHYGGKSELQPDASNLAEVLYLLPNKNPTHCSNLNKLISNIFPDIAHVSSIEQGDKTVDIQIWTVEAAREGRDDLTLPLSACGTGISQVLAILYVVVTSLFPRTIIIDEPQSFLHPGAAKKLIETLKKFPQHQYFIATHSPMLIAAANPSQIIKLAYDGCETEVSSIDAAEINEQKSIMAEVGVRLSDFFGADNVLWVEGKTEELYFPIILERVAKRNLNGTVILGVKSTGQLVGKHSELVFDLYTRLSGGKYLFPPAIGFLLDRETREQKEIDDLKRKSKNAIEFLPRRMYENYLLESEAIAVAINNYYPDRQTSISNLEVQNWIKGKRHTGEYLESSDRKNLTDEQWIERVDAAKLLKDLFTEFLGALFRPSDKAEHSYQLTIWLIEHKPEFLSDLATLLEARISNNSLRN